MPALTTWFASAALLAALLSPYANAHTWIEEMQMIGSNGSYIGDRGFSRGYMARTDPGFNGESDLWLLPALEARSPDQTVRSRINGSDLLCHPSQRSSNYTNPAYPMLKATPGGFMAMKYLENGHVTLPWTVPGKGINGGTVLVFGTTQPQAEEKIVDVMQWTEDGSGGNKRGFLMGAMDYDDGECHQINTCWVSAERAIVSPNRVPGQPDSSVERWCESNVKIPQGTAPGKLTVYWIWDWGTQPGADCLAPEGKDQYYTNCADIEIVADDGNASAGNAKIAAEPATHTLAQQDPNTQAVKNYASRTAANKWSMITAANWADYNIKAAATPTAAQNSSWLAYCSSKVIADQQSAAASPNALPPLCPAGSYAPTGAAYTPWSQSIKARIAGMTTDSPAAAPTTNAPALSTPAATSAPAASSAPAAPVSPSTPEASGATVTVTSTQVAVSTLTTYVATSPAASTPEASAPATSAPAPPASAAAPPASDANTDGFPTISVISNPSAGPTGAPHGGAPPYGAQAGPNGAVGEHPAPPRRHARHFGGSRKA